MTILIFASILLNIQFQTKKFKVQFHSAFVQFKPIINCEHHCYVIAFFIAFIIVNDCLFYEM